MDTKRQIIADWVQRFDSRRTGELRDPKVGSSSAYLWAMVAPDDSRSWGRRGTTNEWFHPRLTTFYEKVLEETFVRVLAGNTVWISARRNSPKDTSGGPERSVAMDAVLFFTGGQVDRGLEQLLSKESVRELSKQRKKTQAEVIAELVCQSLDRWVDNAVLRPTAAAEEEEEAAIREHRRRREEETRRAAALSDKRAKENLAIIQQRQEEKKRDDDTRRVVIIDDPSPRVSEPPLGGVWSYLEPVGAYAVDVARRALSAKVEPAFDEAALVLLLVLSV